MTTALATKRKTMRRSKLPAGVEMRRGPGGEIAVDFIPDWTDLGAPEFYITGIACIEQISAGAIRFTYYSRRKDGNIVTHHTVWDWQTLKRSVDAIERALTIIERAGAPDGPQDEQRRGKH